MRSILELLYFGNLNEAEGSFKKDSTYGRKMDQLVEKETRLTERLDEECKAIYFEVARIQADLNGITALEKYRKGFVVGSLLILKIFSSKENLFTESA